MLRPAQGVILATVGLLCLGVLMIASATFEPGADAPDPSLAAIVGSPATILALGAVIALLLVRMLPTGRLLQHPLVPLALLVMSFAVVALAYVPGIADPSNNSRRWVDLGFVRFQPSEIAKWAVPIALALLAVRYPDRLRRFFTGFLPFYALLGASCLAIAVEDLGTAVLLAAVGTVVLLAGGARLHHVGAVVPVALGAAAALAWTSDYRRDRLLTFLDPFADPNDKGYQILQSLSAISGGDIGGRGLGNGIRKLGYLPEDHTDFIFAVICEEMGLLGAILTCGLLALLVLSAARVASTLRRPGERIIALSIMTTIAFQALMNLMVVTAMVPTKGIALPLVSRGGTGWWMTAAALGLLLSFDRIQVRQLRAVPTCEQDWATTPTTCQRSSSPAAAPAVI